MACFRTFRILFLIILMLTSSVALSVLAIKPTILKPPKVKVWHSTVNGPWDYAVADHARGRLWVARGNGLQAFNLSDGKDLGIVIPGQKMHGVAFAGNRAIATSGDENKALIFDPVKLTLLGAVATGGKPDAVVTESKSGLVVVFNGKTHDATVLDPVAMKTVRTIPLPGKPEFAVADGKGQVYVNLEDRSTLAVLDIAQGNIVDERPLPGCEGPSGLALDKRHGHLFSVCSNAVMLITQMSDGHILSKLPIGKGVDAVAADPAHGLVFSSNGEGTLTVVKRNSALKYGVLATLPTFRSARTLAVDPETKRVFLPAASLIPVQTGKRPTMQPGSFRILVIPYNATW